MATTYAYTNQNRALAMVLALASAVVLSPLYVKRNRKDSRYETRYWSSGFFLPMVVAGLIIAIKTTSLMSIQQRGARATVILLPPPSWVLRIGSSSWGLAGVLIMLMLVLSWQDSLQHFFWR